MKDIALKLLVALMAMDEKAMDLTSINVTILIPKTVAHAIQSIDPTDLTIILGTALYDWVEREVEC